ncbi:MAG: site-2 protease family protein [Vicinamibacterales bacterium]
MTSIIAFIFVLGVLIFVHELGHFIMARRIGVRVLTFSLGFGPKLLSFRRGDTEYCVSAIPLGGYVKMAGENPEDNRTGASDEFLSKSKWQRFQVLIMGPLMNLALAVVVMTFVLHQGADVPLFSERPPVVGSVVADYPAAKVGLQAGDRIFAVNGVEVPTWEKFEMAILPRGGREVTLTIERDGRRFDQPVVPASEGKFEAGQLGVLPEMRPAIAALNPGEPAMEAGLQRGDVILGIGGQSPVTQKEIFDLIKGSEGKPLSIHVGRQGQQQTVTVAARRVGDDFRIGIQMSPEFRTIKPSFYQAMKLSVVQNYEASTMILRTLGGLFTRDTPVRQLMGPVAMVGLSGDAFAIGWISLFSLMAMISLNLGLLNLMPVPVLDGGHIAILALEGLSRRDFSMKVKEKMLIAGFVVLLMLMVTVIYNDLTRIPLIQRLMPWR